MDKYWEDYIHKLEVQEDINYWRRRKGPEMIQRLLEMI